MIVSNRGRFDATKPPVITAEANKQKSSSAKHNHSIWLCLSAPHVHARLERSLWGIFLDVMLNLPVAANRTTNHEPAIDTVQRTTLGDLLVLQ